LPDNAEDMGRHGEGGKAFQSQLIAKRVRLNACVISG